MKRKPPKWVLWVLIGFNILIALAIFCATVYVSFSHTLALYKSVGFTDYKAIAATVAGEALFILGAVNAIFALLFGISLGWVPWVAFILGIILSSWANGAAHSKYGWLGIALGLSTPVFMFVAKLNISNAIKKFGQANEEVGASNELINLITRALNTRKETTSHDTRIAYTNAPDTSNAFTSFDTSGSFTRNNGTSFVDTRYTTSDSFTSGTDASRTSTSNEDINKADNTIGEANDVSTSEVNTSNAVINGSNTSEIGANSPDTNVSDTSNVTSRESTNENGTSEEDTSNPNTSAPDTSKDDTSDSNTSNKSSNVVELAKHTSKRIKKRTSKRTTWTEEDYKRVREIALQLREEREDKKLPGRPKLMEKAGCQENLARRVLDDLKEELKQSS